MLSIWCVSKRDFNAFLQDQNYMGNQYGSQMIDKTICNCDKSYQENRYFGLRNDYDTSKEYQFKLTKLCCGKLISWLSQADGYWFVYKATCKKDLFDLMQEIRDKKAETETELDGYRIPKDWAERLQDSQ